METIPQILVAFVPIVAGMLCRGMGFVGDREGHVLRRFVVGVAIPLFVFFAFYDAPRDSFRAMAPMAAGFVLINLVFFVVGGGVAMLFDGVPRRTAVHACITFGNYGYMGLGVIPTVLGPEARQRVIYFIMLWWPVFYGLGLPIGMIHRGGRKGGLPLRRVASVAAPVLAALALGLTMNLLSVSAPRVLRAGLEPFAEMAIPLILFSLGVLLDLRHVGRSLKPALLVAGIVLLAGPLVGWGLAELLAGSDAVTHGTLVLEGAMPVAAITPVLAECYDMDEQIVGSAICLSTALSLLTIPLVAAIAF